LLVKLKKTLAPPDANNPDLADIPPIDNAKRGMDQLSKVVPSEFRNHTAHFRIISQYFDFADDFTDQTFADLRNLLLPVPFQYGFKISYSRCGKTDRRPSRHSTCPS
jgi:hypothetical protein